MRRLRHGWITNAPSHVVALGNNLPGQRPRSFSRSWCRCWRQPRRFASSPTRSPIRFTWPRSVPVWRLRRKAPKPLRQRPGIKAQIAARFARLVMAALSRSTCASGFRHSAVPVPAGFVARGQRPDPAAAGWLERAGARSAAVDVKPRPSAAFNVNPSTAAENFYVYAHFARGRISR